MTLWQITAAQGPAECQLAVAKALVRLQSEAVALDIAISVLEPEPGDHDGIFRSILIGIVGERETELASRWLGTVQWVCVSPYRPHHARKNWFIGISRCQGATHFAEGEIRYTTCRSSGPGGQHVNKSDSAVRATHVASGISVKVQTERSHHANKRLATALIQYKLAELHARAAENQRASRRQQHFELARGNPVRVFRGLNFDTVKGFD